MKSSLVFLLPLILLIACSQSEKEKEKEDPKNLNKAYVVSFTGMDSLKTGMTKAELEKLLGMTIHLKHIGIDEQLTETIEAKFHGQDVSLDLASSSEEAIASLEGVHTKSALFKTIEGIGVGSGKEEIIRAYDQQVLILTEEDMDSTISPPGRSMVITLAKADDIHQSMYFVLVNKKVVGIGLEPTPEFRDRE
ncbi:MAG: hypothetical protein ABIR30_07515 [Chitinophagaceae bacterium]